MVYLQTYIIGILMLGLALSQDQQEGKYVKLAFKTQGDHNYETPCSTLQPQNEIMSFNITSTKATVGCLCTVQMGDMDQFLKLHTLNGSAFALMKAIEVLPDGSGEFQLWISTQDGVYVKMQDSDDMDLYDGSSDTLVKVQAVEGPTKSVECKPVPLDLILPMNGTDTNITMTTTEAPQPMDITVVIIGIVIGLIVLVVLATLLILLILCIKRADRKKYGQNKTSKSGANYQKVPNVATDEIRRREYPTRVPGKSRTTPEVSTRNTVDIETSFGAAAGGTKPKGTTDSNGINA